ncbi:hypothetical protein BKH42_00170 [Helicobacter sp. 13S00482-2]|uniref:SH3 domain-containing protein n=1 Tax=Helicobacter sp. 13S00482-2 TaxID=1476200 RepID=UPI000BA5CD2C|nr:SH3 domain-containing protein [Helicobacter sp. 13S00482-2]PAF54370.1 hypothetical protein BKH42_00170 [Helicobacter sp. 13S00482-2]
MNIKSLFKLYTIPVLALFFGFGLYYVIFVGTNKQKEDSVPEGFSTAILSQPEMNYKEEENRLQHSSVPSDAHDDGLLDKKSISDEGNLDQSSKPVPSYIPSDKVSNEMQIVQSANQDVRHSDVYVVLGKVLNIRKYPDTTSEVVGKLNYKQNIEVQFIQDGWARLKNGWVYARLLEPFESKKSSKKNPLLGVYDVSKVVNIRSAPTVSSKVVGKLTSGESVVVKDIQDGWGNIDQGWVLLDLLTKQSNDANQ